MRIFVKHLLVVGLLCFLASGASAQLKPGRDYELVKPAQPTEINKIEVIEFFSYMCPHCDQFEPVLNQWLKTRQRSRPGAHSGDFPTAMGSSGQVYYTLEALGQLDSCMGRLRCDSSPKRQSDQRSGHHRLATRNGLERKSLAIPIIRSPS